MRSVANTRGAKLLTLLKLFINGTGPAVLAALCLTLVPSIMVFQGIDPNYGQALSDGTYDSSVHTGNGHHYDETGVSRRFYPDRMVWIEPALRLHWTNGHLDYSYRVVAALNFDYALGRRK